jgi:hypothetical protein
VLRDLKRFLKDKIRDVDLQGSSSADTGPKLDPFGRSTDELAREIATAPVLVGGIVAANVRPNWK